MANIVGNTGQNLGAKSGGTPDNSWEKWVSSGVGGILGGLGGLFGGGSGGGNSSGSAIDQGYGQYADWMQKAIDQMKQEEASGKGDITDYLSKAQAYGQPYIDAGKSGLDAYLGSLGVGGSQDYQKAQQSFHESPAYQYALQQGLQGVQRGTAASGMRGSGAEQKELLRQSQGMANQEYGQWQQQLGGLAGMGQQASEQAANREFGAGQSLAGLGEQYATGLGGLYGQMGQASAESALAKAQLAAQEKSSKRGFWGSLFGGLGSLGAGIAAAV